MGDANGLPDFSTWRDSAKTENGIPADPAPLPAPLGPLHAKTIAAAAKQQRLPNGHFARGNRLASSQPINEFVQLCRDLHNKHQLAREACLMATGRKPYEKVDAATRLKAIEFVTDRAFGRPVQQVLDGVSGAEIQYQRVQYIKRIHGVDGDEV